ncbi:MAG TPA: purine-nucleoside phosphorylase [Clostridiaceae bacterium]|nr:purine-nucleoside phosphorylase [Clostridiaceae bacterium]
MSTPHIDAVKGDIADTVLLPGDPLRAKFIADNFLENAVCFNQVRNMLGYTGERNGKRVSVMGTGMGIPSHAIYTHELIHNFEVKNLIRVGSCGAYVPELKLYDIVLAQGACTDSNYARNFNLPGTYAALASWDLLYRAYNYCQEHDIEVSVGNILSSDIFYNLDDSVWRRWARMRVIAVEMECYALYCNAASAGVNALTILTVSDNLSTGELTTPEERESGFAKMVEIALSLL